MVDYVHVYALIDSDVDVYVFIIWLCIESYVTLI